MSGLLSAILLFSIMISNATGCGTEENTEQNEEVSQETEEPSQQPVSTGPSANPEPEKAPPNFPKPDQICGQPGFNYLLSIYFYPHCNKCHGNGDLASASHEDAYTSMITFENEAIRKIVTSGQFCTGECRLEEGDPILAEIDTWLLHKNDCKSIE